MANYAFVDDHVSSEKWKRQEVLERCVKITPNILVELSN